MLGSSSPAFANTVSWAVWNTCGSSSASSTASGTIGGVGETYSGEISFCQTSGTGNTNWFLPTSTYTSATVSNAPSDGGMIGISGTTATHTFTFASPVTNLVLSEVSLGQGSVPMSYNFNATPTLLSGGANAYWGGQSITVSGNDMLGSEGDGTIEFLGTFSSLNFTVTGSEYWNGFTIGTVGSGTSTGVPEPGTLSLLGSGLVALCFKCRRKFAR